jgi:hypothetical protein
LNIILEPMTVKSRVIQLTAIVFLALGNATLFGQTGPGGIGNVNGSNGQPQNAIWLNAGTLELSNNDPVTVWNDNSGNAHAASQSGMTEQPVFKTGVINGFPAVYFDGSNDHLSVPDAAGINISDAVSVIVVAKPESPDAQPRGLVSKRNSAGDEEAYYLFTHSNSHLYFNAGTNRMNGNVAATADAQIFVGNYDGSKTNPRSFVFNNGSQSGSGNGPTSVGPRSSDLHIGILNPDYGQGFRGEIAEVIVYRNALNAAQLQIVHQYLSVKYGISISNDLFSPVASYVYGVAGVGRASASEAHLIAASEGLYLYASGDIADGDYVFMSNNNLPNGISDFTTSDLPSGSDLRYNRIWYLEKTGTPEARMSFDFSEASDLGKFPASPTNYVLLYRAGEAGSFSVVKNAQGVINGDQVFFDLNETVSYWTDIILLERRIMTESPLEGAEGRTWYTLLFQVTGTIGRCGPWIHPARYPTILISTRQATSPTANADKVFVLNGKTVEVTTSGKQHPFKLRWMGDWN